MADAQPVMRVGIYGLSGSGKTTFCATAPEPLVVLVNEPQGVETIRRHNPAAEVVVLNGWGDVVNLRRSLVGNTTPITIDGAPGMRLDLHQWRGDKRGDLVEGGIEFSTLCVDGFAALQGLAMDALRSQPNRKVSDLEMTQRDWGMLRVMTETFMADARALGCHLVTTFLAVEDKGGRDEDTGQVRPRTVRPVVAGSLSQNIGQFFNAFGYAQHTSGGRRIAWDLPEPTYVCKRPPTWPAETLHSLSEPGRGSLGSIALAMYGEHAAHNACDRADLVTLTDAGIVPVS